MTGFTLPVRSACCGLFLPNHAEHEGSTSPNAQAQIVDILLGAIKLEAAISLPPILHVFSCLARDLQQDFLPYLPRVLTTLTDLVHSGLYSPPSCICLYTTTLYKLWTSNTQHAMTLTSLPYLLTPRVHSIMQHQ